MELPFWQGETTQVPDTAVKEQQGKEARMWRTERLLLIWKKGLESTDLKLTTENSLTFLTIANFRCSSTASTEVKDC